MTTDEFRKMIKNDYKIYKEDMTKVFYPEDDPKYESYGFYLLNYAWMDDWRRFISGGSRPGPINNKPLMALIEQRRENYNFPDDESELGLKDKNHYYILSKGFFKFYYDNFDCDQIITIKYCKTFNEIEINPDVLIGSDNMSYRRNRDDV